MRMVQRFLSLWSLPFVVVANGSFPRLLEEEEFEYNSLADFQLRFEKCQFVKMFDDEQESMLALKHFAVFRLCNDCEECEVYGTYAMEVENYLQYTIESQQEDFETMCENCDERCNEDGEYCSGCGQLCYQYENLEDLGYLDASEYTECNLWEPENGDDDAAANGDDANQAAYYIGPRCNSGNSIAIGVFSDENCWEPIDDVDIEDLLGAQLSYHLLRHTYSSEDQVCLTCMEDNDNDDAADDADDVNQMCENVYNWAAKCESPTGLESGFIQVNQDEGDYENQVENEFMACTFINSLIWDSYTESGEINWEAKQDVILRHVTSKQWSVLGLLSVVFVALFGAVRYFNQKIDALANSSPLLETGGTLT